MGIGRTMIFFHSEHNQVKQVSKKYRNCRKSIVDLLEEVRTDEKLGSAAQMKDSNKLRDGVLKRARDEMLALAAKVRVRPEELEEKTAEMFDACVYMAASAAIHPPKQHKFDFFFM